MIGEDGSSVMRKIEVARLDSPVVVFGGRLFTHKNSEEGGE